MDINQNTAKDNKNQLTERQMTILRQKGLSTKLDSLTQRQKKSIEDIEEMLQYAESKYATSFVYVNYTANKELESGVLTAYPVGGLKKRDSFTIHRISATEYQDTYNHVTVRSGYEKIFNEFLRTVISEDYKSFSQITKTLLKGIPDNVAECSGSVTAKSWIFIENESSSSWDEIIESVVIWMKENNIEGSVYVISVICNTLMDINDLNYTDYLTESFVNGHKFQLI